MGGGGEGDRSHWRWWTVGETFLVEVVRSWRWRERERGGVWKKKNLNREVGEEFCRIGSDVSDVALTTRWRCVDVGRVETLAVGRCRSPEMVVRPAILFLSLFISVCVRLSAFCFLSLSLSISFFLSFFLSHSPLWLAIKSGLLGSLLLTPLAGLRRNGKSKKSLRARFWSHW